MKAMPAVEGMDGLMVRPAGFARTGGRLAEPTACRLRRPLQRGRPTGSIHGLSPRDRSSAAGQPDYRLMVRPAGFEPTASASAGLRSIQLSYERPINIRATDGPPPV